MPTTGFAHFVVAIAHIPTRLTEALVCRRATYFIRYTFLQHIVKMIDISILSPFLETFAVNHRPGPVRLVTSLDV